MNEKWLPKWRDEDGVALFVSERMMRIEEMRDWSWDIDPDGDEAAQIAVAAAKDGTRRKMGRPKMSEQERRAKYPVHDAAEIVPDIKAVLKNQYPDQNAKDINDRACKIAAETVNLDDNDRWRPVLGSVRPRSKATAEKVMKYLSRPKRDRRRIN